MKVKVLCTNDFPELVFPPNTSDEVVEEKRKEVQHNYDVAMANEGQHHKVYVHLQDADWYEEETDEQEENAHVSD